MLPAQQGQEAGVVVGPEARFGVLVGGMGVVEDFRLEEKACIGGDEDPGGGKGAGVGIAGAGYAARLHACVLGEESDFGSKVDVLVADVEGEHAAGGEMAAIEGDGLGGEQMDGDGVAGESIDDEDVELLWSFGGE